MWNNLCNCICYCTCSPEVFASLKFALLYGCIFSILVLAWGPKSKLVVSIFHCNSYPSPTVLLKALVSQNLSYSLHTPFDHPLSLPQYNRWPTLSIIRIHAFLTHPPPYPVLPLLPRHKCPHSVVIHQQWSPIPLPSSAFVDKVLDVPVEHPSLFGIEFGRWAARLQGASCEP